MLDITREENIILAQKEFNMRTEYMSAYPTEVQIAPTEQCNLNCYHCYRKKWEGTFITKDMDIQLLNIPLVKAILAKCQTVWVVSGGEPLLYKNFFELLTILSSYDGIQIYSITNGTLLDEHTVQKLVQIHNLWLKVSIDGSIEKTVDEIRGKNVFSELSRGVRKLTDAKNLLKVNSIHIIITFVIMKRNYMELPGLLKLAKEWGIDTVEVFHCQPLNDDVVDQDMRKYPEKYHDVIEKAATIAEELNINFVYPEVEKEDNVCDMPWKFFYIDQQGNVYPCCNLWGYCCGNIYENKLSDIWNGERFRALRREIQKYGKSKICEQSACPYV